MIETNKPPLFWAALLILLFASVISALVGPHSEYFAPPASATWIAPPPPQGAGYAYRRTITIDHTKIPNTDQSNFPLLISGTYSYLATVANGGNVQNANGYDVIFTSDLGCATKLDHEVQSYSAVSGSIARGTATVLLSTRFMYGSSASTIAMWQTDYVSIAIHELVHLSAIYAGYDDTQLTTAASKLPGAAAGLPAPPKDYKDMNGILANSGYYHSELMKHCGAPK